MNLVLPIAASTPYPLWAAVVTASVGVLVFYLTRRKEATARQRETYAKAWKAALGWREMVYRVRRRAADGSDDQDLVRRFHDLQEDLDYYEGVLTMERETLGSTYRELAQAYKEVCMPLLQDAWSRPGRPPAQGTPDNDEHPDADDRLKRARATFANRARSHLNGWDNIS